MRCKASPKEKIEARWGEPGDEARIAELLDLNGMPHRAELAGGYLTAGFGGEAYAALEYRVEWPRLLLGRLVSDPLAGERPLARVLYAEAHALAREMKLAEVRAALPAYGDYPYDVGYRRRYGHWSLDTNTPLEPRGELPESRWRRVLALLGALAVPRPKEKH